MDDKQFWEYFGFKVFDNVVCSGDGMERFSRKAHYPDRTTRMMPVSDLNNLFRYCVPLISKTHEINIAMPPGKTERYIVRIGHNKSIEDKDPAQALRKAIEKAIGG